MARRKFLEANSIGYPGAIRVRSAFRLIARDRCVGGRRRTNCVLIPVPIASGQRRRRKPSIRTVTSKRSPIRHDHPVDPFWSIVVVIGRCRLFSPASVASIGNTRPQNSRPQPSMCAARQRTITASDRSRKPSRTMADASAIASCVRATIPSIVSDSPSIIATS